MIANQSGPATMSDLTIWTLDWVPEGARGFVRDLRLRWACEEAGVAYAVRTVPFDDRETNHLERQPFGQVPFLDVGGLKMFESGAGLLHLARTSDILMPPDPAGEAETVQWAIAALNSIEMVSVPWRFLTISGEQDNKLSGWLAQRLDHVERVLSDREWLAAGRFTVADLLMADVLRVPKVRAFSDRSATEAYVTRVTDRLAFKKAYADQTSFFEAADKQRSEQMPV
ncbi:MAG TPA: glutathione S-transferase family protein [Sphingobium sp.]|nr:glutathione S-transferase family protein [Sphingobium sp.]